jgi:hypothetical protein
VTRSRETVSLLIALVLGLPVASAGQDAVPDVERDDRIGLADLTAYRAALSGKPTADEARPSDPPARVGFRELWDHPESYRGRRVTVQGRLERTFRQGAVGSFPPLVEAWLFSASGDPFCAVYPRPKEVAVSEPGRSVRFTGTFLKTVRYPAGDGDRLAPLIVGDRPPEPRPPGEGTESAPPPSGAGAILRAIGGGDHPDADRRSWTYETLGLGLILAAMAAFVIARQHLRASRTGDDAVARRGRREQERSDPPLLFVDSLADEIHSQYETTQEQGRVREDEPPGESDREGEPPGEPEGDRR